MTAQIRYGFCEWINEALGGNVGGNVGDSSVVTDMIHWRFATDTVLQQEIAPPCLPLQSTYSKLTNKSNECTLLVRVSVLFPFQI